MLFSRPFFATCFTSREVPAGSSLSRLWVSPSTAPGNSRDGEFDFATRLFLPLALIAVIGLSGCNSKKDSRDSVTTRERASDSVAEPAAATENPEATEQQDGDYASRISRMYEEAKESGTTTATNAAQWIAEISGKATSLGADAAETASDQLQQLYQQARLQGETSVSNTRQWAVEDFQKIGDWQYVVESITNADPEQMAIKLNEMGTERWECFWVDRQQDSSAVLYFKRPMRSYIQRLPYRDLIRLIPMLGGGEDASEP